MSVCDSALVLDKKSEWCEEFLHIFHMKICAHKTHLGMELPCSYSLTSKGGSM